MRKRLFRGRHDEAGAVMVEYALACALIAIVAIKSVRDTGEAVKCSLQGSAAALSSHIAPACSDSAEGPATD